eukprot:3100471-Pyramimonas_sp.AAC.1
MWRSSRRRRWARSRMEPALRSDLAPRGIQLSRPANCVAIFPDGWPAPGGTCWLKSASSLRNSGIGGEAAASADCGGRAELDPHGALAPRAEIDSMWAQLDNC